MTVKNVMGISLGSSTSDFEETVGLLGVSVHICRQRKTGNC